MLRYWTAGESHGKTLLALIDGFPAGLSVDAAAIDVDLQLRQGGYGRGGRQKLETDTVEFLTGVWQSETLVPPSRSRSSTGLQVGATEGVGTAAAWPRGFDWRHQVPRFHSRSPRTFQRSRDRRSRSCRISCETAPGEVWNRSHWICRRIGGRCGGACPGTIAEHRKLRSESIIYSLDPAKDEAFRKLIDETAEAGDTVGGIVEVRVEGLPFGWGLMPNGTESSTAAWLKRSWRSKRSKEWKSALALKRLVGEVPRSRSDSLRCITKIHPFARIHAPNQSCGRFGRGNDQRAAIGHSSSQKADQHPSTTTRFHSNGIEGAPSRQLRTERRLRGFGGCHHRRMCRCF